MSERDDNYGSMTTADAGLAGDRGTGQGIVSAAKRWDVDWPLGVNRRNELTRYFGVQAYPVVVVARRDGIIEAVHGRWSIEDRGNGLDNLEIELQMELSVLLDGGTWASFVDWEKLAAASARA